MDASDVTFRRRAFAEMTPVELYAVLRLRGDAFVVEQGIHEENDVDGEDPTAVHVLGTAPDGEVVATARMHLEVSPPRVSRIAVAKEWRGKGVGSALMRYVNRFVGPCGAWMSAQAYLETWYGRFGWFREGEEYDEVGIPHVKLVKRRSGESRG